MLNKAQTRFIGLGNFTFLLSRDVFWMVVRQTAIFALSAVFFKALIGLITAHLINNLPAKGQRKWRGMMLVPWVIPLALSSLSWWWLFDPTHSAFNWIIEALGGSEVPWLSNPYWARFSVILVNVWFGAPFFMIMYLAALKSVPEQLYEAAAIDGANWWQKHVYVTLPQMSAVIEFFVVVELITMLSWVFSYVFTMTGGGPGFASTVMEFYIWEHAFAFRSPGIASALAVFLLLITSVLIALQFRVRRTSLEEVDR